MLMKRRLSVVGPSLGAINSFESEEACRETLPSESQFSTKMLRPLLSTTIILPPLLESLTTTPGCVDPLRKSLLQKPIAWFDTSTSRPEVCSDCGESLTEAYANRFQQILILRFALFILFDLPVNLIIEVSSQRFNLLF